MNEDKVSGIQGIANRTKFILFFVILFPFLFFDFPFLPVSSFAKDEDLSILVPDNDRHSLPFASEIQQVENFVLPELTKIHYMSRRLSEDQRLHPKQQMGGKKSIHGLTFLRALQRIFSHEQICSTASVCRTQNQILLQQQEMHLHLVILLRR